MKPLRIIVKYGHIYDADTKQRITLKEDTQYVLVLSNENDITETRFDKEKSCRSEEEIRQSISLKGAFFQKKLASAGEFLYFKISIKNAHKSNELKSKKEEVDTMLRVVLQEDLYVFAREGNLSDELGYLKGEEVEKRQKGKSSKRESSKMRLPLEKNLSDILKNIKDKETENTKENKDTQQENSKLGVRLENCKCYIEEIGEESKIPFFEKIYANTLSSLYRLTHVHYFGNEGSSNRNVFETMILNKNTLREAVQDLNGWCEVTESSQSTSKTEKNKKTKGKL